jgi:acyl-coenzyme A thioesterase PaaI-like protein
MTKIIKKQPNSRWCFVCGVDNEHGLKARFYENDEGELEAYINLGDAVQGYPDRMHGGVAASILDEAISRAIFIIDESTWGVTTDLHLKYRNPLPLNCELKVLCRITRDTRLLYEGTGEIYTPKGKVAVSAKAQYMKIPMEKLATEEFKRKDAWDIFPD